METQNPKLTNEQPIGVGAALGVFLMALVNVPPAFFEMSDAQQVAVHGVGSAFAALVVAVVWKVLSDRQDSPATARQLPPL